MACMVPFLILYYFQAGSLVDHISIWGKREKVKVEKEGIAASGKVCYIVR